MIAFQQLVGSILKRYESRIMLDSPKRLVLSQKREVPIQV